MESHHDNFTLLSILERDTFHCSIQGETVEFEVMNVINKVIEERYQAIMFIALDSGSYKKDTIRYIHQVFKGIFQETGSQRGITRNDDIFYRVLAEFSYVKKAFSINSYKPFTTDSLYALETEFYNQIDDIKKLFTMS